MQVRIAVQEDVDRIRALMKESMRVLGEGYYTKEQIQSCCQFVCVPDLQLIEDGTFFVAAKDDGSLVGCGGWSFRKTLYAGPSALPQNATALNPEQDAARIRAMFTSPSERGKGIGSLILTASENAAKTRGFKKGRLGATLSGLAFYQSKGWRPVGKENAILPDGVLIDVVTMEKSF